MRAFLEKRKKAGLSERAIVRQLHRRFGSAINRELQTNPVTQKRVQHHVQQKQIRNYRVWARPFVRAYFFIRSKFIK